MNKVYIFILVLFTSYVQGQINPPQGPRDCIVYGDDYSAIVSQLTTTQFEPCEGEDFMLPIVDGVVQYMSNFTMASNSIYFKSTLDISNLMRDGNNGYFQFLEFSRKSIGTRLPSSIYAVLQASIVYDSDSKAPSLLFNYKTASGYESLTLDLDLHKRFDVTLAWIASGCIFSEFNCDTNVGQLYVRVDLVGGFSDIAAKTVIIKDVMFKDEGKVLETKAVYWGELDKYNLNGDLILSRPN